MKCKEKCGCDKKEKIKCRKRRVCFIIAVLVAFVLGVLIGIHRRVIYACIMGEPLPELPASHKKAVASVRSLFTF
ncbi:MAG: hypothetical protein II695_12425 [Oscillospiraceae bacterium]|nr:hypothetical protein [Oscillospiraceae bacterium]